MIRPLRLLTHLSPVEEINEEQRATEIAQRKTDLTRRQSVAQWVSGALYAEREANHFAPNIVHAISGRHSRHEP